MLYQGSFNLWRSIFQWQYFQDGDMLKLWLWLVGNANIEPQEKPPFGRIERGQIAVSVATLELVTRTSPKMIRERLKKLEISGEIVMKKTNQFHIITICNYDKYQPQNFKKGKRMANERQADVERTASQGKAEGEQKATMIYNNTSKEDIIITTQPQNSQQKNCKNNFLKKGEKSFFEISEIKSQLDAENIFMTKAGYEEFKRNNESDQNNFNYNGGIPNAARFFLKKFPQYVGTKPKPENEKLYENLEVSARVKQALHDIQNDFSVYEWQTFIRTLKPVCDGERLNIWCPTKFVAEYVREHHAEQIQKLSNILKTRDIRYMFDVKH